MDWRLDMKLCDFCKKNILESGESWDFHHRSYESLRTSAEYTSQVISQATDATTEKRERCLFCWRLQEDVDTLSETLAKDNKKEEWPLHRWSIRSLARIRESLECIVVTFRWVPRGKKDGVVNGSKRDSQVILPTRTFYLFEEEGKCAATSKVYLSKDLLYQS